MTIIQPYVEMEQEGAALPPHIRYLMVSGIFVLLGFATWLVLTIFEDEIESYKVQRKTTEYSTFQKVMK